MTVAVSNQETMTLDIIEKMTSQILRKINCICPRIFASNLKFLEKSEKECFFSKMNQKDRDFILGLKKKELKNSQYDGEIDAFVIPSNMKDKVFSSLVKENRYFTDLNSELHDIEYNLDRISLKP